MLVIVHYLIFNILPIEVLVTVRCNILHNLNFLLTFFNISKPKKLELLIMWLAMIVT